MITEFYDQLSPFYHLIFPDWNSTIEHQAKILDGIIKSEWKNNVSSIVDVSCGIGTQAIGLAKLGYDVTGSDLSPKQIERATEEAKLRDVEINFLVCDMRNICSHHAQKYDLLICCDNSIPHLLCDLDIRHAFKEFYRCLNLGGGCLITIRDYQKENRDGIQIKPYNIKIENNIKYIIFQTWEFQGDIYDLSMYCICDNQKDVVETKIFRSQYYAVSILKIVQLLKEVGFTNVRQIESNFYQPVIIATKSYE